MTRARIIGISGASGGVGATCLVAAVGLRGQRRGLEVVCVDLRRYGGGLDVTFGIDHERGLRWPDLARARGRLDVPELLRHLPRANGLPVVSHDRDATVDLDPQAVAAVVDGLAAHSDLVVIDLPAPGDGEFASAVALLHQGIVVCGSGPAQLAAAGVHASACVDLGLSWEIVQRLDRRAPPGLAHIVGDALGLPVAALLPDDERVGADLRRGRIPGGRGHLAEAADAVLEAALEPMRSVA